MTKYKTTHQLKSEIEIGKSIKNKWVIVLQETDLSDKETAIIGVADNKGAAIRILQEYYGDDAFFGKIRQIEDSGLNFEIDVVVDNCNYSILAIDFEINSL